MNNAIYSASLFETFAKQAGTILFLLALGSFGLGSALFSRRDKKWGRVGTGAAGVVLLVAGTAFAVFTLASARSGTRSLVLAVERKQVAIDNCGNNGGTCKRYVLEARTSTDLYDFNVPPNAYDVVQVGACYQFSYYPGSDSFGSDTGSYHAISNIARIARADPGRCH